MSSIPKRMPEAGDDVEEKRVATDIAEMFAKQVGRSLHIAGGRGAEDLDVVALPVHLPATVTSDRDSGSGVEVAEGELEGRSGLDGEAQRFGDVLRERKGYDSRARQRPAPSRPRSDSHDEPGSAPVAHASRVTTIRYASATRPAANTRNTPVSIPWKAQNRFAGW